MGTQVMLSPPLIYGGQQSDIYLTDLFSPYTDINSSCDLAMDRPSDCTFNPFLMRTPSISEETSSMRRPSLASSRSPPPRDRTPIKRHRVAEPRPRSTSRSEALLQYAREQSYQQPTSRMHYTASHPSHSAPTTPQNYPMSGIALQPVLSNTIPEASNYFESVEQPQDLTALPAVSMYDNDDTLHPYYLSSRNHISDPLLSYTYSDLHDTSFLPPIIPPQATQLPPIGQAMPLFPPILAPLESLPSNLDSLTPRPKPQCWDHGCNGRQFSTFSNLLRHQREKSGSAMKSTCPHCGTEFTRTTARNGHLYGGKCKGRPEQSARSITAETRSSTEVTPEREVLPYKP